MAHLTKEFVTAGRAVFTLEVPDSFKTKYEAEHRGVTVKPHYTFRVKFKKGEGNFKDVYFVQLLTGPDNTRSYSYLGILEKENGTVRLTAKSCRQEGDVAVVLLRRALARVWAGEVAKIEQAGFKLHHEGKCGRYGRALTTPTSVSLGIGPECLVHMNGGNFRHLVDQNTEKQQDLLDESELEEALSRSEDMDLFGHSGFGPYDRL